MPATIIVPNINSIFEIAFEKYPELANQIIEVAMPGISIDPTDFRVKEFRIRQLPTQNEPTKEEMTITFNADENFDNYYTIYTWIRSGTRGGMGIHARDLDSDIILTLTDLNKRPIMKLVYKHCFPTNLSEMPLNTQDEGNTPLNFTATFVVNDILITRLDPSLK